MGKAYSSLIVRPLKNFNIETKAHKVIDKNVKPKTAPRHENPKNKISNFVKEKENTLKTDIKEKNIGLDERLRGMIAEVDKSGVICSTRQARKLPENRSQPGDEDFGYVEPEVVKEGYVTIKHTMEFLGKHFADPSAYTVENIAKDYKISIEDAKKIVNSFNIFLLHVPKKKEEVEEPDLLSTASMTKLPPNKF